MKTGKKIMTLIIIALILILVLVWFRIPYSPLKAQFNNDADALKAKNNTYTGSEVFAEEDFADMPAGIQKYIENCGFIGKPKTNYVMMEYHDVDFAQGKTGPKLKIDYTQIDFVKEPVRMALIQSYMFGIPFQGYDYFNNGTGGMKGVLAKCFTLFDQRGREMDRACLATYLAECIFAPSALLQDNIVLEELSEYEVKVIAAYKGETVSGIYHFNDEYEMISFTTNDRAVSNSDGSFELVPWTAECGGYEFGTGGIKYPTTFKAIWNYSDGDFTYFDGKIAGIETY